MTDRNPDPLDQDALEQPQPAEGVDLNAGWAAADVNPADYVDDDHVASTYGDPIQPASDEDEEVSDGVQPE